MIPNYNNRQVESQGVSESHEFGISINDAAHIMNILRNTIYSDKVLAVLREYSSNAWDAHVEAGKGDVPIKVILPTSLDPVLTIRDFGAGLSVDDMFTVFTKYGASTKRKSDSVVGMLGIGSKSGFAYSDNFTLTSWNGGMKRVYVAVLDETEKGTLNLLDEEPCGDETGLQVQIPVKSADIWEFTRKAKDLFKYYKPLPDINTELPVFGEKAVVLEHGFLSHEDKYEGWVALMGCVPYDIDLDQLVSKDVPMVGRYVRNLGGALFFNIGELRVSSSREGLQYNEPTKLAIAKRFEALAESYVAKVISDLTSTTSSIWQLRVQAQLMNRMALPIPSDLSGFVRETLDLPDSPVFSLYRNGHEASKIDVSAGTQIIIRDDQRDLAGFDLWGTTYIAKPKDPVLHTHTLVEQAVLDMLKTIGAEGLPLNRTSSLSWTQPHRGRTPKKKRVDKKHHVRSFKLIDTPRFEYPQSKDWEIVKREPTPEDVFVVIKGFKAGSGFVEAFRADRHLAEVFDKKMPAVYAYKHKKGKPDEQFIGTPYMEWSKEFTKGLLTDDMKKLLNAIKWKDSSRLWRMTSRAKGNTKILGKDHPINFVVRRWKESETFLKTVKTEHREFRTSYLLDRVKDQFVLEIDTVLEELKKKYPLLFRHWSSLDVFWDKHESKDWLQYVRAIDQFVDTPPQEIADGAEAEVHSDE